MKRIMLITALLMTTAGGFAQTEVTQGVMRGKDYGVTYALPKTLIDIEIATKKTVYTPGEFSKYAERYLHLNNVSTEASETWEITGVKVNPVGVPNSNKIYFIKMKDKTVAPLVELTEDGIIKSINVPLSERIADARPTDTPEVATPQEEKLNPRDFLTEEILMAGSTAKMAELVAKEIYAIRDSKNALLRGQADNTPKDGQQLKLMLDNLDKQERAMTQMFTGTQEQSSKSYSTRIDPSQEMDKLVVFRFSKRRGVVASNDLSGEPVYAVVKDLKSVVIPPEDDKKKKKEEKEEGIAYNVPGRAYLLIQEGKEKLYEGEIAVAQYGSMEYLAPVLFNKNSTVKVTFNPVTGGLIKVDKEEAK